MVFIEARITAVVSGRPRITASEGSICADELVLEALGKPTLVQPMFQRLK